MQPTLTRRGDGDSPMGATLRFNLEKQKASAETAKAFSFLFCREIMRP
jgi:hypothetical protein